MTTAIKERPILFSAPMVRALLDGRKTQTRRVVKWKFGPNGTPATPIETVDQFADLVQGLAENLSGDPVPFAACKCPYGVPGDRLWVRETWQDIGCEDRTEYIYLASVADGHHPPTWRPSIHMPRAASRITLEVVSVRVERVRDISEADAIAEGFSDKAAFRDLFFNINKRAKPDENPWVWAVEFKVVKP